MKRRQFLGGAAMAAGAAAAGPVRAAATGRAIWLYDPALAPSQGLAARASTPGAELRRLEGDRIRLAQTMLAAAPHEIGGITRYADFLLLSGAAAERGYRVTAKSMLPDGALRWTVRRR